MPLRTATRPSLLCWRRRYLSPVIQASVQLPPELADKVASWPEVRMGVHRVTLVLRDGSRIRGVLVAGN